MRERIAVLIILTSLSMLVGCSIEKSDGKQHSFLKITPKGSKGAIGTDALTVFTNADRICSTDAECAVVDRDCCQAGDFIAVNNVKTLQVKGLVRNVCEQDTSKFLREKQLKEGQKEAQETKAQEKTTEKPSEEIPGAGADFCAGKKAVHIYPTAICKDSLCEVSAKEVKPEEVKPEEVASDADDACEQSYECLVLDKDCCHTGAEFVGVNKKSYLKAHLKASADCKEKLKENENLCSGKSPKQLTHPVASCVDKQCKIQ